MPAAPYLLMAFSPANFLLPPPFTALLPSTKESARAYHSAEVGRRVWPERATKGPPFRHFGSVTTSANHSIIYLVSHYIVWLACIEHRQGACHVSLVDSPKLAALFSAKACPWAARRAKQRRGSQPNEGLAVHTRVLTCMRQCEPLPPRL